MQQALEELQRAIQHVLALGLGRAGGLEPLRDALRALQPHDALAPLAEGVQAVLDASDTRVQLDMLTRLHYTCERLQMRLRADTMPTLRGDTLHEPTRKVAAVVPPSSRFPPTREGSEDLSVPPAGRGNLQEGVQTILALGALFWGVDRLLATEYVRLITWVPSRTALLGTVFSVWAMYALLRGAAERRWGWLMLGSGLYLLALGSYEQPITLVALVGALAFWQRREWGGWGARAFTVAALCVALILALRFALLPAEPTTYQRQQLRSSLSGPVLSYLTELLPPVGQWQYWRAVGVQLEVLLVDKTGWDHLVGTLLYLGVLAAVWRWRGLLGGAWLWHALAFLPMAFLHLFEHYMYLPQLGKTLFDVGLIAWSVQRLRVQLIPTDKFTTLQDTSWTMGANRTAGGVNDVLAHAPSPLDTRTQNRV